MTVERNKSIDKKLKTLEDKLSKCETERDDYLSGIKKLKADSHNEKQYQAKSLEIEKRSIKEKYVSDILPIFDSISAALTIKSNDSKLIKGLELIRDQYLQSLSKFGVEILIPLGEKFNPHLHEAVGKKETNKREEDDVILEVIRPGAKIDDKVIKAPIVQIGEYIKK